MELKNILFATDFGPVRRRLPLMLLLAKSMAHIDAAGCDRKRRGLRGRRRGPAAGDQCGAYEAAHAGRQRKFVQPEFRVAFGAAVEEILLATRK